MMKNVLVIMPTIYRTEENFGGKKLWRMGLTAALVKKNFGEFSKVFCAAPSNNGRCSEKCAGSAKGILIIIIIS